MKTLVFKLEEGFDNQNLPEFDNGASFVSTVVKTSNSSPISFRFSKVQTKDTLKIKCGDNAYFTKDSENLNQEVVLTTSNDIYYLHILGDIGTTTTFSVSNPLISNVVNSQLMLEGSLSNLPDDTFINATFFYGIEGVAGNIVDVGIKMPNIATCFLQYSVVTGTLESLADTLKGNRLNGSTLAVTGNTLVTYNGSTFDNIVKTITFDGFGGYSVN